MGNRSGLENCFRLDRTKTDRTYLFIISIYTIVFYIKHVKKGSIL